MVQFLNDMLGEIDSFVGIIYSSNDLKEAAAALAVNEDKYTVFVGTDEVRHTSTVLGIKITEHIINKAFEHFLIGTFNCYTLI